MKRNWSGIVALVGLVLVAGVAMLPVASCPADKPETKESAPSISVSPSDARQALAADQELRQKTCLAEIERTLKDNRCELVPVTTITGGRQPQVLTDLRIVPMP